jgi:hypothetical protein
MEPQKRASLDVLSCHEICLFVKLVCPSFLLLLTITAFKFSMSQNQPQLELIKQADPKCDSCGYVLPSQTSSTGLRCGLDYFKSSYIMRKFQLMQHFPEVHAYKACEAWANELVSQELQGGFTFLAPRAGDFKA